MAALKFSLVKPPPEGSGEAGSGGQCFDFVDSQLVVSQSISSICTMGKKNIFLFCFHFSAGLMEPFRCRHKGRCFPSSLALVVSQGEEALLVPHVD